MSTNEKDLEMQNSDKDEIDNSQCLLKNDNSSEIESDTDSEDKNKFLGKNFVFDHRRAEKISDHVVANCHQCGSPCDVHVNCANEACHLLFIQCKDCSEKMETTCSVECQEIIQLPYEEQKKLRKGSHASNKIFKKGRSEKLLFKN